MRQIKFRAWDGEKMLPHDSVGMSVLVFEYLTDHGGIWPEDMKIMQFTGLKDKNGMEVYEGDVVKNDNYKIINWPLVVEIDSHMFAVVFKRHQTGLSKVLSYDVGNIQSLEVIGNVWENPELLKHD